MWAPPVLPVPCEQELAASARMICRDMLDVDPAQASVLHSLGMVAAQENQTGLAVACLRRAVALDEKQHHVEWVADLADALERRGEYLDSIRARLHVIRNRPDDPEAFHQLGQALQHHGKHGEAVAVCRESLRLDPRGYAASRLLGESLDAAGRGTEALVQYEACLQLRPGAVEIYERIGRLHLRRHDWPLALDAFEAGLRRAGLRDHERAALLLGWSEVQIGLGNHRSALSALREVLSLDSRHLTALSRLIFVLELTGNVSDTAQAWLSLGVALEHLGRVPEALNAYQQAVARQPDCLDARLRLGTLLIVLDRVREAVRHLELAVDIAPEHVMAHVTLGAARHLSGRPDDGWNELRWLSLAERIKGWHTFEQPMWDGSSLVGKTVLLWATPDLGLGDTLQFVRGARVLKARGARCVIVECQPPLVSLVARMADVDRVVVHRAPLPPFDVHAPLMLVPVLERSAREPYAGDVPYLSADPEEITFWREQLDSFDGATVGLCWGAQSPRRDARWRTLALSEFAPLSDVRDVRFISLQIGSLGDEAFVAPRGLYVRRALCSSVSIAHTAALVQALDLVITADTMVAHLAGALGQACWTLLPYGADWRWGRGDITQWYPAMRLFRQQRIGEWATVMELLRRELDARCRRRT